jgi:hypothetical protein
MLYTVRTVVHAYFLQPNYKFIPLMFLPLSYAMVISYLSFVGSDKYVLHALSMYIVQLNSLVDRLITLCVHYQHLLALLRHCFLTKVSHIFRTITPQLTFVFATQINDI